MQTISIPYRCSDEGAATISALRHVYSSAVRTAYANAVDADGRLVKENDLRHLVKSRFAGGCADAWILHCATLEGREARKRVPDGKLVFGSRKNLQRRNDGKIDNAAWKARRLLSMASRGDRIYAGNRHFKLSLDGRTCTFSMLSGRTPSLDKKGNPKVRKDGKTVSKLIWQTHTLELSRMFGNQGEILRQAAQLAADKKINVMFRIDETHLHVTIDPMVLPDHPERRSPVKASPGRMIGVDLNPLNIGYAAVMNATNPEVLLETRVLEWALAVQEFPIDASNEMVQESLARICDRIIGMARKHRAGTIVLEKGLGKLRSSTKSKKLNRQNNYWTRTVLVQMLTRKARLAGIKVVMVWAGYSTTIGNLAFEAPDACASAAEIGRRGLALASGSKIGVLPAMAPEVVARRWKDGELQTGTIDSFRQATSWGDLHRKIKSAKLGVRRPHPEVRAESPLYAVRRLGMKHRPGLLWRPVPTTVTHSGMTTKAGVST